MRAMSDQGSSDVQVCPACSTRIATSGIEPLAGIVCPSCGQESRVECTFDHFRIVETLGVGGMGAVYKAHDQTLDRFVALKLLRGDADTAALQHEARLTASVNHPNVVKVFSSGVDHGQFYLVMELVDRGSLDDLIARDKRLPETLVVSVALQIVRGLQAAQARGLIHRDIKPANILFADGETAKISDFGLAGANETAANDRVIWGTPFYVAPERLDNQPEDFRSDIYSLGATLFHALAGRPPIEGETTSASKLHELKQRPPALRDLAPRVSRRTAEIVDRMIAPAPNERFASYDELIAALRSAHEVTPRNRRGYGFAAWALLLAGVLGLAVWWLVARSKPAPPPLLRATSPPAKPAPDARVKERRLRAEQKARAQAEAASREKVRAALLAKEKPLWETARHDANQRIARYEFAEARDIIAAAVFTEDSLQHEKARQLKRLGWLVEWKGQLIDDLNGRGFLGAISDLGGLPYTGLNHATSKRLRVLTPYGSTELDWTRFSSETLLTVSCAFIKPAAADAAERRWHCAVFASATAQPGPARKLAEEAASADPAFRSQLPLIVR